MINLQNNMQYVKHERISLRKSPHFSETWLHDRIIEDPAILGLGPLDVVSHEKVLCSGGKLDMLLTDVENATRYEVEIMLGATDPSHIVRCIEYWDIERRRYPGYDHIAVLIAEEVTSRFLNVMSLLAGSIPLVAIQLNALRVGEQVILDFVKVLDQRSLRIDETGETGGDDADRGTWEAKAGGANMQACDRILAFANANAIRPLEIRYKKAHLGICEHGAFFNVAALFPKKSFVACRVVVADPDQWVQRAGELGIEAERKKEDRVLMRFTLDDLNKHESWFREIIQQSVLEMQQ